jgi:hypothetical protein
MIDFDYRYFLGDKMDTTSSNICDMELIQKAFQARFGTPWSDSRAGQFHVTIQQKSKWSWREFRIPPYEITFTVNVVKITGEHFGEMIFLIFHQRDLCRVPITMFYENTQITKRAQVSEFSSRFDLSEKGKVINKRNFIAFKLPIPKKYLIFDGKYSPILRYVYSLECEIEIS